ncbi:MAG: shikimate kinase [Gemmatimonadota bacterium]
MPRPVAPRTAGPKRLLLVGFMGSGKSAVGRRLARRLRWRFFDQDREVERTAGLSVPQIFRLEGEARFRELEAEVAARLLEHDRAVIATGGGWPCAPGRLEDVPAGTLSVWLHVSPEVAVARARASHTVRPLLEVEDPLARAGSLLEQREPFYRKARWEVETDHRAPHAVARELVDRLRSTYGTL